MSLDLLRVAPVSERPSSSVSQRSVSRASQRPVSRLSQRSKQPRLAALLHTLVNRITGLPAEHEDIQRAVDLASKQIDQIKQPVIPDLMQIEAHFRGHVKKARINMQDVFADLMHAKYSELKSNVAQHVDLDSEIKLSMLPHHLHFLLLLSSPPSDATLLQAETMLQRRDQHTSHLSPLTWKKILKEEPFEGEHWQGAFGLLEGSTVETWDDDTSESDAFSSLSISEPPEDIMLPAEHDSCHSQPREVSNEPAQSLNKYTGRDIAEKLRAKQYWRSDWRTDAVLHPQFDIRDASTLGPATSRVLLQAPGIFSGLEHESYINEVDAVREVLMSLQGRRSCLFQIGSVQDVFCVTPSHHRRIVHFTSQSQASVFRALASHVSILNPLRDFVLQTHERTPFLSSTITAPCHTSEAFSAAIARQLILFDKWCAEVEECICLSQRGGSDSNHAISLLRLEKEVGMKLAATFQALLGITHIIQERRNRLSPSTLSALVLNALLKAARSCSAIGDTRTAQSLMDVWKESAEPLWTDIGRWLKEGIPIRAGPEGETYTTKPTWNEKEFFIRMNPLVDIGSPEFWKSGSTLRPLDHNLAPLNAGEDIAEESDIPEFLQCIAEDILAAGKAIGLLRALNMGYLLGDDWLQRWQTFGEVTDRLSPRNLNEDLENLLSNALASPCRHVQSCFREVLVDQCDLWKHVLSLEQVYLMMRGDAMSHFGEKLFARMDAGQPWSDFHFLNSAFRDVSKYGSNSWINSSLVRISHRGVKDKSINRTVRAIDGLSIEYAIPFPLTFLFGPNANASYSLIFNFLLQIKRSKSVLDRILIRGLNSGILDYDAPDLKVFYVLRSKLSWFINTLLNFIMIHVIHTALIEFHEALRNAVSLDEMILIHGSHLERLLGRCLLQENTSALHRAILSILDISLHFSECLAAFAGDTSLDVSRRSLLSMRHRHRRSRFHKPDMIGFVDTLPQSEDDTESEVDDDDEPSISVGEASISFGEESFFARLERINVELDGLVRFVRHGVESLAGGLARKDAAVTFEILAFSLEDWSL